MRNGPLRYASILIGLILGLFGPWEPAWPRPESIQVWFLSEGTVGAGVQVRPRALLPSPWAQWPLLPPQSGQKLWAATDWALIHKQCVPLGQQYFHPQLGPHAHEMTDMEEKGLGQKDEPQEASLPGKIKGTGHEDHLGKCDEGFYFDLYCGTSREEKQKAASPLEVWIDISSSFLRVDASQSAGCFRSQFVDRLKAQCEGQDVRVYLFDTQYSQLQSATDACATKGLNDTKRMIQWIEKSNAKSLVFITDISEFTVEFANYLNTYAAKMVGTEKHDRLTARSLLDLAPALKKECSRP